MKYVWSILLAALLAVGVVWVVSEPVQLDGKAYMTTVKASGEIVYVDSTVWASTTRISVRWVDQFTTSTMSRSTCRPGGRCIHIRYGNVKGAATGWTSNTSYGVLITIEPGLQAKYRIEVLEHELGHAFYLYDNPRCVSRMYTRVLCGRHQTPARFTTAERRILARH